MAAIAPPKSVAGWYEDPNEVGAFIDLVNQDGFVLEDAVQQLIATSHLGVDLHFGEVFEGASHRSLERVEIDVWLKTGNFVFILEIKRSDFDWVFLQNRDSPKDIHLLHGIDNKVSVTNRVLKHVDCVSRQVVEVCEEKEGFTLAKKEKGAPSKKLPIRSARDEYVRCAIRQVLFNTERLIHSQLRDRSWRGQAPRIFIPVVMTNAKLLVGDYQSTHIDSAANLTQLDVSPINVAAYNHSEILRHGRFFEVTVDHIGSPAEGGRLFDDTRFKGSHNKTVFVVTKDSLCLFIEQIKQNFM